jgi:2,3-bisphosphoglycerate-independent phosphoglycerate mutase
MEPVKPVLLVIMDGWGIRAMEDGNAPLLAKTPNIDRWQTTLERSIVDASEEAVGLTPGQMGNSEVGHLNLGAGRVVYQDITRIELVVKAGTLGQEPPLQAAFEHVRQRGSKLHLIGLLSDGGVHSHITHLLALLEATRAEGIDPVIHVITDGRDTPTASGLGFVGQLEDYIAQHKHGRVATVSGRYYAMDRDKRWERTAKAYVAMTQREGHTANSAREAVEASYAAGKTDEFIEPIVIAGEGLALEAGDAVVCFNFRADRMRQLCEIFVNRRPEGFDVPIVEDLYVTTFTVYADDLPVQGVLFGKETLKNTLGEVLAAAGKTQYHTAETEKYPHVTYFFNGRREAPYEGESRRIIPSPKVATYDLQPEMSAYELAAATLERIQSYDDDFILVNFANPDMVGHTGSLEAAIKACEVVDECTGKLVAAINAKGGTALVTADHGNCERMVDEITHEAHTYHTTQPVHFFAIGATQFYDMRPRGKLADVAPTVLHLLGVKQPADMTGVSLIDRARAVTE